MLDWTLIETLVSLAHARIAGVRERRQDGLSEIVVLLLAVSAAILIGGAVFAILRAKAVQSANNMDF